MLDPSPAETYDLDDLASWNYGGASLAVVGYPARHSISPQMHNAALAALSATQPQLRAWRYLRFEIPPERLLEALPIFHAKGFHGLNLTLPHKEIAAPAVAAIDPQAKEIGAVNTLLRLERGYKGHNTDGYGLSQGIAAELDRSLAASDVVLLGAGGAGRAAAIQCLREGCRSLLVVNRNPERLRRLLGELEPLAQQLGAALSGRAPDDVGARIPGGALVINATSLGLKPDDALPLDAALLPSDAALFDMIYNPPETRLMRAARARGCRVANGLAMLVAQGARSLEIWTGAPAPVSVMREAANRALGL